MGNAHTQVHERYTDESVMSEQMDINNNMHNIVEVMLPIYLVDDAVTPNDIELTQRSWKMILGNQM